MTSLTLVHSLLTGSATSTGAASSSMSQGCMSPGRGKRPRDSPDTDHDALVDQHLDMRHKRARTHLDASPALSS